MTIAIGFFFYIQQRLRRNVQRVAGFGLLLLGLIASLSRGPWAGAVVTTGMYIITGRRPVIRLAIAALAGACVLLVLSFFPAGQKLFDLIPYIGESSQHTISYREELLAKAIVVIERNPLLGSVDYLGTPELESMRQGQGIIDVVNTYLQVALETGLIGLMLFCSFFIKIAYDVYRTTKLIRVADYQLHCMGRALLATLVGMLFMIFAISSVTIVPIVYWSLAAIGVAYAQLVMQTIHALSEKRDPQEQAAGSPLTTAQLLPRVPPRPG
jgi:O-antigen ligase